MNAVWVMTMTDGFLPYVPYWWEDSLLFVAFHLHFSLGGDVLRHAQSSCTAGWLFCYFSTAFRFLLFGRHSSKRAEDEWIGEENTNTART
jgi:hypothetical protein